MKRLLVTLGLGLLALPLSAQTDTATPTETAALARVEVSGGRSSVMPYAQWVRAAQPVYRISQGQLRQGVRLYSRVSGPALRVAVGDEAQHQTVAPVLGGLFVVPHELGLDAEQAQVSVNRAQGDWGAGNFALVPQLPEQGATMAQVRQVLRGYQAVYREHFPLRWRLLSRADASLDLCAPEPGQQLTLLGADGQALAQLPLERQLSEHRETTGRTLHCASLRANAEWGDDVRLALPPKALPLLGFRML
jgi:hypothetical protein